MPLKQSMDFTSETVYCISDKKWNKMKAGMLETKGTFIDYLKMIFLGDQPFNKRSIYFPKISKNEWKRLTMFAKKKEIVCTLKNGVVSITVYPQFVKFILTALDNNDEVYDLVKIFGMGLQSFTIK